jgi:hypothetical protein
MSAVFSAVFNKQETGVPTWIVNQLLSKVELNLRLCPTEVNLAKDSANLLVKLVDKPEKATKVLPSPGLWTVIRYVKVCFLF